MKKLIILLLFSIYTVNYTFCNEIEDKRTPLFHYPGYTIETTEKGYKIYKGNSTFSSNLLYTIEYKGDNLKIFKGDSSFSTNLIYAIESDNRGYKIYKGDTSFSSNLTYVLEYINNGYKIYNGDPAFLSNLAYTVECTDEYYKVYKGNSSFSSNLIYYMSREALEFFKNNKIRKEKNIFNQFLFQPQLLKQDKRSRDIPDLLINSLLESLLEHNR